MVDIKQLHSRNIMCHRHTALFYCSCHCYAYCVLFFPSPHAVPKRALQRDKYGSQTKHCLSNVIDFGFYFFFSLDADSGAMKVFSFGSNITKERERALTISDRLVKKSVSMGGKKRLRAIWYNTLNTPVQLQSTLRLPATFHKEHQY